jgi:hypothetical protein
MTEVYLKEKINSCYISHDSIMSRVAFSIFETPPTHTKLSTGIMNQNSSARLAKRLLRPEAQTLRALSRC